MSPSNSHIITLGNRKWLVGMAWRSFEDIPDKIALEKDAEQLKSSWVCVRVGQSAIQAGFCQPVAGVKNPNKLYSLAAMLADSREQPWLGVFKISDDKYWLVAIRDKHAILPSMFPSDGDFVGSAEEVRNLRDSHAGMGKWTYIDGTLDDLAAWIKEVDERPTRIRVLNGGFQPNTSILVGTAALFVASAAGGYWWYEQKVTEERIAAERRAAVIAQIQAGKPIEVPSPLLTTPTPDVWLNACRSIIYDLPISHMGWLLTNVSCTLQDVAITWKREAGATVANRPAGEVQESGDEIEQHIPLLQQETGMGDDSIDLPQARLRLRAWAQAGNFNLTFSNSANEQQAAALPGAEPSPDSVKPVLPSVAFAITTLISPFELQFSQIPGLRLNMIKTTETGWLLEGVLYGRRAI